PGGPTRRSRFRAPPAVTRPGSAAASPSRPEPRPWRFRMFTRRDFLRHSTLLTLAPTVPAFLAQTARAAAPQRDGRVLVVIELNGGNDGINTVVPFKDDGYARHR